MTNDEAIAELRRIRDELSGDPEAAHSRADDVLLAVVSVGVKEAYDAVVDACTWWACA